MPLQSNLAFAAVAPDDVPIPSAGYYAFFVSDGTASGVSGPTVAGGFYKKEGVTGVVTPLIPIAYSNEEAQDAVGGILTNSSTVAFTYNDVGNTISAVVPDGSITNAKLADMATGLFKARFSGGSGPPEDITGTQATTLLDPATITLQGLLSAIDKSRMDNFFNVAQYNVLDWGVAPANTGPANVTAMNVLMATAVDNATLFFPPGPVAYDFATVLNIPGGKHFRFLGGGSQKSMIRTTNTTDHIFTVNDWYSVFEGLKFTTSVTRTGGAAIYSGNNVGINVKNCDFLSMYDGIVYAGGASAGNLAVVHECNWSDTRHFGIQIDGTNCNAIISKCVMDGTLGQQVVGVEVNACGSLIISDSDFIRCQNNLNLNPDSGTKGVFSVYCTNIFFDTSSGSSVKFSSGASSANTAIQRVKFANCWFSGSVNGCEFAAGPRTNFPSGIDFINCDIYSNTANGVLATAVKDFAMSNCRVAGNVVAGVNVLPSAGAVTKFNLQNNTFGPTAGIGANGIGVNVGAGVYGGYVITGNTVDGNTTNLNIVDLGTVATTDLKQVINNPGSLLQGLISSLATTSATAGVTETLIHATRIPANSVIVGSMFRISLTGTSSSTGTLAFKIRVGSVGTVAGDAAVPIAQTFTTTAAQIANSHSGFEAIMVVRSIGAAGTVKCEGVGNSGATAPALIPTLIGAPAVAVVNTTLPWFIDVTCACSVGTYTVQVHYVEAL